MSEFTTKLDIEDERRNLWAAVIRGLFGVIRIMERYAKGWTTGAPTDELREAADRIRRLADQCDEMNIQDPKQPRYDFK